MATAKQTETYDAVVIGTGQGGKPLAQELAEAGWRTAVIERDQVGGSCINYGCTPTKTMVASARVAYLARRGAEYGVRAGDVSIDLKTVVQRKRTIVESFRGGSRRGLEETDNLDLIMGEASFEGAKSIVVRLNGGGERRLSAGKVFINTGTRSARPRIEGLEAVPTLDNVSIMENETLPGHLLVLGGGYIGVEFGQMFRRFGSRVTIVQRGERLLGREDGDVADAVAEILRDDGIEMLLGTTPVRAGRGAGGGVSLTVKGPGGERTISGSHLLLAAGRTPNTDRLNLEAAGIATDRHGFIRADDRLRTSVEDVYAIGDVKGGPAFTHISYDDYRILRANLLENGELTIRGRLVPYTVFMDPQLGRVGMTESEAKALGREVRVAKLPMEYVARAIEMGETRGFMKALVEPATGQILGCAVLGIEGGEVMAALQMAMMGQLRYQTIRDGIFAHPTLAESLNNLFMTLED